MPQVISHLPRRKLWFWQVAYIMFFVSGLVDCVSLAAQAAPVSETSRAFRDLVNRIDADHQRVATQAVHHLQSLIHQGETPHSRASLNQLHHTLSSALDNSSRLQAQSPTGSRLIEAWHDWLEAYDFVFRRNLSGMAQPTGLSAAQLSERLSVYQHLIARLDAGGTKLQAARLAYLRAFDLPVGSSTALDGALTHLRQLNAYQLAVLATIVEAELANDKLLDAFSAGQLPAMASLRSQLHQTLQRCRERLQSLPQFAGDDRYRREAIAYLDFLAKLKSDHYSILMRYLDSADQVTANDYNSVMRLLNEDLPAHRRACREARRSLLQSQLQDQSLSTRS